MTGVDTAAAYREWAAVLAHGSSPSYERLARAVADDPATVRFLDGLMPAQRQPNLLFAALRWHGAPVTDPSACLAWLASHGAQVRQTMRTRRTQTNEVARCALLLPVLTLLPAPLALIEVGTAAGLGLRLDQWAYRYLTPDGDRQVGAGDQRLTLTCAVEGHPPLPAAPPPVAWRMGLDQQPIDPADPDARRWLSCLIWPEHTDRAAALTAALDQAARTPVPIRRGDLLADLPALLDEAPADATIAVMHSVTLAYVTDSVRDRFTDLLRRRGVHRVGAEGPQVLPHLRSQLPPASEIANQLVISLDDSVLALGQMHGRALHWLARA
jgi:hypothetical protein